jgi:excisionase family DNA binding protein
MKHIGIDQEGDVMSLENERLLDLKEAGNLLSLSKSTLLRWIKSGKLEAVKIGKQWRISAGQIRTIQRGGRYTVQSPGSPTRITVDTLEAARMEKDTANNTIPGHFIIDNWTGEAIEEGGSNG